MDEEVLEELAWSRSMGEMLPVVEGWAAPVKDPGRVVRVLGVDLLRDRAARELSFEGRDGKTMGDEAFRAAWVQSESFFRRGWVTRGRGDGPWLDSVPIDVTAAPSPMVLAGTLPDPLWMEGAGEKVAPSISPRPSVFLGMEVASRAWNVVTPGPLRPLDSVGATKDEAGGTRLEATEELLAVGPEDPRRLGGWVPWRC
jgi:hypothetical protein